MKSVRSSHAEISTKAPTDIAGFDDVTGGSLRRDRTTLPVCGPGSDKTKSIAGVVDDIIEREVAVDHKVDPSVQTNIGLV